MSNRHQHIKQVAEQSLDKFMKAVEGLADEETIAFIASWQEFINDADVMADISGVQNIEAVLGFGRNFSTKLSNTDNLQVAFQRLAEVDLARHIIREFEMRDKQNVSDLEKLAEDRNTGVCDFMIASTGWYFEAKYTKNISRERLSKIAENAAEQIETTAISGSIMGAWIWIFTFTQPKDPREFQRIVVDLKPKRSFPCTINVQVYGQGYYGDGPST